MATQLSNLPLLGIGFLYYIELFINDKSVKLLKLKSKIGKYEKDMRQLSNQINHKKFMAFSHSYDLQA